MSERIDHAAEARRLMSATDTRDWKEESPYVDRRIAAAHVHATLALVEQQRIANLIALASEFGRSNVIDTVKGVLQPDIAQTLGVEQ